MTTKRDQQMAENMTPDNLSAKDVERLFQAWIIDDLTDNRDRESYHLNALECFDFWRAACAMYDALLPARAQMKGSKGEFDEQLRIKASYESVKIADEMTDARIQYGNGFVDGGYWAVERLTAKPDEES